MGGSSASSGPGTPDRAPPRTEPTAPPGASSPPSRPPPETVADSGAVRRDSVHAIRWTSSGATKVLGDVDVEVARLSGLTSVKGRLSAVLLNVRGILEVGGDVRVSNAIEIDGTARLGGAVQTRTVAGEGDLRVSGRVEATTSFRWRGRVEFGADATAPTIDLNGSVRSYGEMSAAEVRVVFRKENRIRTIKASRVQIRPLTFPPWIRGTFSVERIEGSQIDLRGVRAEFVRGDAIILGPGCHIIRVEGPVVERSSSAHVGPESESPPPHGLSR